MLKKLGRNDPCHCGSGNKYKRCCLDKDEAGKVTRITPNNPGTAQARISFEQLIKEELIWANSLYQLIAGHLVNQMSGKYPDIEVVAAVRLWNEFSGMEMPVIKKAGVFPAAVEYCICQFYGHSVTQASLAEKYGISAGSISQRVQHIMTFIEQHGPPAERENGTPITVPAASGSRMNMERKIQQIAELMQTHQFSSIEEANAFIQQIDLGTNQGSRKRARSKKEQAQELLYNAWDEPNAGKRAQMAKDALLLYPDSADAYNILAESGASSMKEMAYYYKQGMLAGERDLGEEFFRENKGHFWGFTPSRPFMRAKKGYAEACFELKNIPEAIRHYKELLELNPMDNQGVRELLLIAHLETEDWRSGARLIEAYSEDGTACFNYDRILIEYGLHGVTLKLSRLLKEAAKQNPHVPKFLLGKKRIPRQMPDYIGFGDEQEAIVYAQTHNHIWQSKPELLRWLGSNV
ncbi:SEC-C domain-containing protein [Paenibacillus sp. sptzw28]|uniref:SEC-C metal-binding domain-containing protein n=1 Tax=Paenibacillus sp. sptzw28 TaxID=715179 RepID=UPI001C6E5929|nr:SEC-C metal-binding domain-containing protein [Paenibacillus sp. sptzw28]QYR20239.1 SEC-C domain-containing protein [Paenibacillus sp. sptzw28]